MVTIGIYWSPSANNGASFCTYAPTTALNSAQSIRTCRAASSSVFVYVAFQTLLYLASQVPSVGTLFTISSIFMVHPRAAASRLGIKSQVVANVLATVPSLNISSTKAHGNLMAPA